MKKITQDVKLKNPTTGVSEVVATIEIDQWEALDEALESLGESKCVAYINQQHKAKEMNAKRGEFQETKAGKKKMRALAFKLCDQNTNPENYAKLLEVVGDYVALEAFLDSLAPQVEQAIADGTLQK